MIFPDIKLQTWLEKTKLGVVSYKCEKCGKIFETNIPVITKESIGLMSPIHDCGGGYWVAIMRAKNNENEKLWSNFV